jgi:hypothetical protein
MVSRVPFRTNWPCLTTARLQTEAAKAGIPIHRRIFHDIREVFKLYPRATAVFNCTGLGALTLRGVEDKKIYAARVRKNNSKSVCIVLTFIF